MARARCCCQVVTASRCWWNGCQAYYQPITALPVVSHHINIFIFLQIFLRLRERSMLEEELFSLFKGNTKLLRSAAAGVARVGRVGGCGLYSYHRSIHLVPATTTTTTTLLQLRGLSTRCRQLGPGNKSSRYDIIIKIINGNMRNIFFGESYPLIDCLNLKC